MRFWPRLSGSRALLVRLALTAAAAAGEMLGGDDDGLFIVITPCQGIYWNVQHDYSPESHGAFTVWKRLIGPNQWKWQALGEIKATPSNPAWVIGQGGQGRYWATEATLSAVSNPKMWPSSPYDHKRHITALRESSSPLLAMSASAQPLLPSIPALPNNTLVFLRQSSQPVISSNNLWFIFMQSKYHSPSPPLPPLLEF